MFMSVELISIEEAVKKASEYVHLVVKNIKEGEIDLTDLVYINESKGAELRKYSLNSDDIIIALSSNVGNSSLFDINEEDVQFTLSHYLARIKCDKRKINPKILVYYLNSKAIWKYFRVCETGKTKKNISIAAQNRFDEDYYANKGVRRSDFKIACKVRGWDINDFNQIKSGEKSTDGKNKYFYIKKIFN